MRRGEKQRQANTGADKLVQRAARSAVEQLECRQLFASVVQGITEGADIHFAWEAEHGATKLPAGTADWLLMQDGFASGPNNEAWESVGGNTGAVTSPGLRWTLGITDADKNYKLYIRRSAGDFNAANGGNNSVWVPAVTAATGIGALPGGPVADAARSSFDDAASTAGDFGWTSARNGNAAQSFIYDVAAPGNTPFEIRARENDYKVDRIVLSTNHNLTPAQLDTMATSPIVRSVPGPIATLTAAPDTNKVTLNWSAADDAQSYKISRSSNGGPFSEISSGLTTTTFEDTVPALGNYTYRVTPVNDAGDGPAKDVSVSVNGQVAAPAGFRATNSTATAVSLAWTANPNATNGYKIYRADRNPTTGLAGTYTEIATVTGTTYTDAGAADNGTVSHFYQIASVNAAGTGAPSTAIQSSTVIAATTGQGWSAAYQNENSVAAIESAPEYRTIDATINMNGGEANRPTTTPSTFNDNNGNGFAVSWQGTVTVPSTGVWHLYPNTDDGVRITVDGIVVWDNYIVGQGPTERDITVKDTASTDNTAGNPVVWVAGSTHTVRMDFQQGGGGWHADLRWAPDGDAARKEIIPTSRVAPLAPTAPVATANSNAGSVRINWNQTEAKSYRIEQQSADGATWTVVTTVPATVGAAGYSHTVTGLTNGQAYTFRVVAINQAGEATSNSVAGTPAPAAPEVPQNVTATPGTFVNATTINVNVAWTAVAFADSYIIERAPVTGGTVGTFGQVGTSTTNSFVDATGVIGSQYVYRVTAKNTVGNSAPSANSATVDVSKGVHEYRYTTVANREDWNSPIAGARATIGATADNRMGWTQVGDQYDLNVLQPNVNSPRNILDNYSRLYTGKIVIPQTGTYVFATNSDDESFVTVDGKLVASLRQWGYDAYLGGNRDVTAGTEVPLTLTAGQEVNFQYWMREGGGGDYADLKWKVSGTSGTPVAGIPVAGEGLGIVPREAFRIATGAPLAPTGVSATKTSDSVTLTFTDAATNELRYRVERGTSATGPFTTIHTRGLDDNTTTDAATFTDLAVQPSTTYFYRVVAENYEGATPSAPVSVTTDGVTAVAGAKLRYYDQRYWNSVDQSTTGYLRPGTAGLEGSTVLNTVDYASGDQNVAPPGAPAGDNGADYSVVISGKLRTNPGQAGNTTTPETYRFITQSDDDSYLVVNGKLVAANPGGHADNTNGLTIYDIQLMPNTEYNFQYYQAQGGGGHGYHMRWIVPGDVRDYAGEDGDPVAEGVQPRGNAGYALAPLVGLATATAGGFTTSVLDAPAAPTLAPGGTFSNVIGESVTISFVDNAVSETKYVLQRATSAAFTDAVTLDVPMVLVPQADVDGGAGTTATFNDSGLTAGQTYFYRLQAVNYDGASAVVNLGSTATANIGTPGTPLALKQPNGNVVVTWQDRAPVGTKVSIERSVNGGAFTELAQVNPITGGGANSYTDTTATGVSTSYQYRVRAIGGPNGAQSGYATAPAAIVTRGSTNVVDFSNGFTGQTSLTLNGNAVAVAQSVPSVQPTGALRLTNRTNDLASSAYTTAKVPVTGRWVTQFDFNISAGVDLADGFGFVIQNQANNFVGGTGGGLGYNGMNQALTVKFDTHDKISSTGLFLGNVSPGNDNDLRDPATLGIQNDGINLNQGGTGIDLHSGRDFRAIISYDGTKLYQQVIDLNDAGRTVFQYDYGTVDIAGRVGGTEAYIGFASANGGLNQTNDIKNWVYSQAMPVIENLPAGVTASAGATFTYANGELSLTSGTLTFAANSEVDAVKVVASGANSRLVFDASDKLAGLRLSGGAQATVNGVGAGRSATDHRMLVVPAAEFAVDAASRLDLRDNDMVVRGGDLSAVAALIRGGQLLSSVAVADLTTLGFLKNDGSAGGGNGATFTRFGPGGGEAVAASDVLIKYTYYGDADLDGDADGDDYFYIDNAYVTPSGSTWGAGDFDNDGDTDGDDYFYIDNAYGNRGL